MYVYSRILAWCMMMTALTSSMLRPRLACWCNHRTKGLAKDSSEPTCTCEGDRFEDSFLLAGLHIRGRRSRGYLTRMMLALRTWDALPGWSLRLKTKAPTVRTDSSMTSVFDWRKCQMSRVRFSNVTQQGRRISTMSYLSEYSNSRRRRLIAAPAALIELLLGS